MYACFSLTSFFFLCSMHTVWWFMYIHTYSHRSNVCTRQGTSCWLGIHRMTILWIQLQQMSKTPAICVHYSTLLRTAQLGPECYVHMVVVVLVTHKGEVKLKKMSTTLGYNLCSSQDLHVRKFSHLCCTCNTDTSSQSSTANEV